MPETASSFECCSCSDVFDAFADADEPASETPHAVMCAAARDDDMLLLLRPALGNRMTLFSMSTYDSNRLASFKILGLPIVVVSS